MGLPEPLVIDVGGLDRLIKTLSADGYRVLGPVLRDDAIVYDDISAAADLPRGWTDRQEPGRYRAERSHDDALFGYAVGPHSWKRFLHPPVLTLFEARRTDAGFTVDEGPQQAERHAFVGVRACELAAIAIQDRVFQEGPYVDPDYRRRRDDCLLVAVNCTGAASTCFCTSMGTGPEVTAGFDLALTEVVGPKHEFVLDVGSPRGAAIAERLAAPSANARLRKAARRRVDHAREQITRSLETDGLPRLLEDSYESPHWDAVAERCLACTNCTMVCPTCFCTAVEDLTDLTGEASRVRRWDSCFNIDFSYMHGGAVRTSAATRYRQWFVHKLGTWHEQFGSSGCVGCGRCITWCPVGIDLTAEAQALRERHSRTEESRGSEDA